MQLVKLTATNFRAYHHLTINFADLKGLTLLTGINKDVADTGSNNGSAKTTYIYAIIYALYGQLPNGTKGDTLISKDKEKNLQVTLSFIQNKHTYRIERYRKHSKYKNKVLLYQDDKDITLSTNKLTDEYIVKLVGVNLSTLLNSLVFSAENTLDFASATDKQRKTMLEELTNTRVYRIASELVKDDLKQLKQDIANNEQTLSQLVAQQSQAQQLLESYQNMLMDYHNQVTQLQGSIKSLESDLASTGTLPTEDDKQRLETQLKALKGKLHDLSLIDTADLNNQVNQLQVTINSKTNLAKQNIKTITNNRDEVKRLQANLTNTCRYCGSTLTDEHRKQEIDSIVKDTKRIIDDTKNLQLAIKNAQDKLLQASQTLQQQLAHNKSLEEQRHNLMNEYTDCQSHLAELDKLLYDNNYNHRTLTNLQNQLASLQKHVPQKPTITDYTQTISKTKTTLQELNNKSKQLNRLVKLFGNQGVINYSLSLVVPYLNERLSHYLDILTNGNIQAQISVTTQLKSGDTTDKLSLVINSLSTGNDFNDLSSGERKRISVALNLAFSSYLLSQQDTLNIAVFDEIFDSLDEQGINGILTILKEFSENVATVFVISHNANLANDSIFDNVVTVTKENGVSQVGINE